MRTAQVSALDAAVSGGSHCPHISASAYQQHSEHGRSSHSSGGGGGRSSGRAATATHAQRVSKSAAGGTARDDEAELNQVRGARCEVRGAAAAARSGAHLDACTPAAAAVGALTLTTCCQQGALLAPSRQPVSEAGAHTCACMHARAGEGMQLCHKVLRLSMLRGALCQVTTVALRAMLREADRRSTEAAQEAVMTLAAAHADRGGAAHAHMHACVSMREG